VRAGNTELARGVYRQVLEINPANSAASNELADLLARRGDIALAEEVLREQLEVAPEDRQSSANLVQALLLQGEVEAAEIEARNLLELEDTTGLAEFQLGRVLQARQSSEGAIAAYQRALEKNPTATEPLQGLIQVLITAGRADEAIEILNTQIEEYPSQTSAKLLLASVHATRDDLETAVGLLEEVIVEHPEEVRAYALLGSLYPDDPAARIVAYERGFKANPETVAMGLVLGTQYEMSSRFEDAISVYEALLIANPDNEIAINNLAALLLDRRTDAESFARALEMAKRFERSDSAALVDTLGWAYYRTGDYRKAIPFLEDAVSSADEVPLLHYHLGMAYFRNQNPIRAQEELERSIDLAQGDFPGIDEARETLGLIPKTFELD
jgi:tetratricopeptide (TPR) repeat protein